MSDIPVAQAKTQFAQLVHQAEAGCPVHITRRGRAVAVWLGQDEFRRLSAPAEDWLAFTLALRSRARAAGLPLWTDAALSGLRDQSGRAAADCA